VTSDASFVTAGKTAHLSLLREVGPDPAFFCALTRVSDDPRMSPAEWWYEIVPLFEDSPLGGSTDEIGLYEISGPAGWSAFVAVLRAYMMRRDGNRVALRRMGPDGEVVQLCAGQSEPEIRDLLAARFGAPAFGAAVPAGPWLQPQPRPRAGKTAHLWCFDPGYPVSGCRVHQLVLYRDDYDNGWWYDLVPLLRESLLGSPRFREALPEPDGPQAADYWFTYALLGSGGWAALASVLRAYIKRHKDNKVIIYMGPGEKALELGGRDYSANEIRILLHAKIEAELLRSQAPRQLTANTTHPPPAPHPAADQDNGSPATEHETE
jgi:hypothetical protein